MNIGRLSRRPFALNAAKEGSRPPAEFIRTVFAVALAVALIATGAIALPSLAPVEASVETSPAKGPQLEPEVLADIEGLHEEAGMLGGPLKESVADIAKSLPSAAARVAKATTAVTKPIAGGVESIPSTIARATEREAGCARGREGSQRFDGAHSLGRPSQALTGKEKQLTTTGLGQRAERLGASC